MYRTIEPIVRPTFAERSPERIRDIQTVLNLLSKDERLAPVRYPWTDLTSKDFPLHLVGFGSLMSRVSAERTLHKTDHSLSCPVIAFGAKRVYNYVMSPASLSRYNVETLPYERGVLNTLATGLATDYFNGISIRIHRDDFARFTEREFAYDLIPVVTLPWNNPHGPLELAYSLSCREEYFEGRQMLSNELVPHPAYHELCANACREISSDFLTCFEQTTWVATDITPVWNPVAAPAAKAKLAVS